MAREQKEEKQNEQIKEMGTVNLEENRNRHKIKLLTIIGEIEGHEAVSGSTKATKYEHLLPMLAEVEDSEEIEGLLILLNTLGGDVEAGLSIAEMIASLSKPTVSLVLGGSHSIGGPLAVSSKYSFIVPSGTMVIHRNVYRCGAEPPQYDQNPGSDHTFFVEALQNHTSQD